MSDESTLSEPKVGAIVREYAGDIVEALKSDPDALANALDPVWTKAALKMHGNNFSLVRRASDFTGPSDPIHGRYYVEEHPFPGGGLRVTNDWYADQRDAIMELLVELEIVERETTASDLVLTGPVTVPAVTPGGTPIVVGGTLKGYAIGNAQNLAVRSVLDMTAATPSKAQWAATVEKFDSRCTYCEVEFSDTVKPVIEHVVPINRTHLGENVIGNIVPACADCNSEKGGKSLDSWLMTTTRGFDIVQARRRVREHMDQHGYVPLSERMEDRAKFDAAIERMRSEMLEAAQRCAALIREVAGEDAPAG